MTPLNHDLRWQVNRWRFFVVAIAVEWGIASTALSQVHTDATDSESLDVVTVTAQRRVENLQATPISIATISGETLERQPLATTGDLARYVPGLLIGKSTFGGQTYLRGVGQSNGVPGGESPVATYLDGVYLGAPALAVFDLDNISQIAVLKGPQGTLFGRNATGGLVQITTREASPDFRGTAEAGYGNFNTLTGRLYVTGAVAPTLSASLAFSGAHRQDGYIRNVTTGADLLNESKYTLQNKWLLRASDNTDIKLNLLHGKYRNLPGAIRGVYPGALAADGVTPYLGEYKVANRVDGLNETEISIASATVAHDAGWGKITSQTSIASFLGDVVVDQSGHPGQPNTNDARAQISDMHGNIKSWTEEFQLQAPADADFQWIAGFFYLHDLARVQLDVHLDETPFSFISSSVRTDSWSVFGQATQPINSRARITAGLRYTRDTKDFRAITGTGARPASTLPTHKSWSRPTWRLALEYEVAREVLGYVSYNRGFKSGAYTNTDVVVPPAAPETVDAFELGLKSQLLDNRIRINGAAFYYDYTDLQLRAVSGATILVYNAANSRVYGIDAEMEALIASNLTVSAGLEYLHARYTRFPAGPVSVPTPMLVVPSGCSGAPNARNGGTTTVSCDLAGNEMVKAPKLSAIVGLQFETGLAGGTAVISVQDRYSSRYFFEPDNVLEQAAYHWVDATVSWSPDSGPWKLTLWGSNLTGARVFNTAVTAGNSFGYAPGSPTLYGVTLKFVY